jgi:hypothetical protein
MFTELRTRGLKLILRLLASCVVLSLQLASVSAQAPKVSWGNPDQPWGVRRPVTAADRALIASYRSGQKHPAYSTNFADDADFNQKWAAQTDERTDLASCREPASVTAGPTQLRLRTLAAPACHSKFSTGSIWSKFKQRYGFFEASIRIADSPGLNNAFWLVTDDKFEIDIAEVHFPDDLHITLHNNNNWTPSPDHAVGFDVKYPINLSKDYHDYGVLWKPTELIFEVDGEPVAAMTIKGASGTADVRLSTALGDFGGKIPANPVGHEMDVRSLRIFNL